ncbi:MAG: RtcB family protein [Myxococcaceae bacterium]|jgi:tRNA-splicing ligase RtcB|nr:RtcB family protein [Myxococcaceae bacterium]
MTPLVLPTRHAPLWVWRRTLPDDTRKQLVSLAERPWVRHHVAVMPDAHGSGHVAVGTVFVTDDVIVPGALGDDLGCGVTAVRLATSANELARRDLEALLRHWTGCIPIGDGVHRGRAGPLTFGLSTNALERQARRLAPRHLGTLGGGNHFVELDRAHDDSVWLLVHSGSRGLGGAIGHHHQRVAGGPLEPLALTSPEGRACWNDLHVAFEFARNNRAALLASALDGVRAVLGLGADESSRLDLHHNFVARETHAGDVLLVHRKGAIRATRETLALIPGSMGTASYLVRGLGHPASFESASHGAGRVMTRREARTRVPRAKLVRHLRHVVFDVDRAESLVEEAPSVYRPIREVLEDEADLVEPVLRLEPLVVLKG